MTKYKKFWLVGGTAGIIFYAAISILLIPFGSPVGGWTITYPYWIYPTLLGAAPVSTLFEIFPNLEIWLNGSGNYGIFVIAAVVYFAAGATIGWIYGKIRK